MHDFGVQTSPCRKVVGQVVLSCGKRSEQRKTQLADCMCNQNPAEAGLSVSPINFHVSRTDFWIGYVP